MSKSDSYYPRKQTCSAGLELLFVAKAQKLRFPVITINNKFLKSFLSGQDYQKLIELP